MLNDIWCSIASGFRSLPDLTRIRKQEKGRARKLLRLLMIASDGCGHCLMKGERSPYGINIKVVLNSNHSID